MDKLPLSDSNLIKVKVYPNSNENSISYIDGIYKVRVTKPADKNKANKELIRFLTKHFKKKARIKTGLKSRDKVIELI